MAANDRDINEELRNANLLGIGDDYKKADQRSFVSKIPLVRGIGGVAQNAADIAGLGGVGLLNVAKNIQEKLLWDEPSQYVNKKIEDYNKYLENRPLGRFISGINEQTSATNLPPAAPVVKQGAAPPVPNSVSQPSLPGAPPNEQVAGRSSNAENWPPSWATKNGWNISGQIGNRGIGVTPLGEQPTAVRTSEKNRPGKGIAGVTLETDRADTTLIRNPNYRKGVVDPNGYAHVDDRPYIEVENQYKGQQVPLLQGIGIPKKESEDPYTRQVEAIRNNPENWKLGTLSKKAQAEISALTKEKMKNDTDLRLEGMRGQLDNLSKILSYDKDKMTDDQKRAADIFNRHKVDIDDGSGKKYAHQELTFLNIAEKLANSGDVTGLPKDLQEPVAQTLRNFEFFLKPFKDANPNADPAELRHEAYQKYKKRVESSVMQNFQ